MTASFLDWPQASFFLLHFISVIVSVLRHVHGSVIVLLLFVYQAHTKTHRTDNKRQKEYADI